MKFAKRIQGINSSFVRDILKLTKEKDIISFAGGLPLAECFPTEEFDKAAHEILKSKASAQKALQYGESAGLFKLREIIAESYKQKDNLDIDPELVLITNGSQQGLDLVSKVFIESGDKLLLEAPSYLAAIQAFQFYEPEFVSVGLEQDGPNIVELEQVKDVKLFYFVPNFQNPSGVTWQDAARQKVADWARQNDVLLLEDDPYGEIRFEGQRQKPLLHFYENTIMLGSFSKILAPGLRLGWIVAPNKEIFDKLLLAKQSSDLHTSEFTQSIAAKFYENFDAQAHIEKISKKYKEQKDVLVKELEKLDLKLNNPEGGMFVWARFKESVNTVEFLKYAVKEGVAFVPGAPFFVGAEIPQNYARFNYTNADAELIKTGVRRLKLALEKYNGRSQ